MYLLNIYIEYQKNWWISPEISFSWETIINISHLRKARDIDEQIVNILVNQLILGVI